MQREREKGRGATSRLTSPPPCSRLWRAQSRLVARFRTLLLRERPPAIRREPRSPRRRCRQGSGAGLDPSALSSLVRHRLHSHCCSTAREAVTSRSALSRSPRRERRPAAAGRGRRRPEGRGAGPQERRQISRRRGVGRDPLEEGRRGGLQRRARDRRKRERGAQEAPPGRVRRASSCAPASFPAASPPPDGLVAREVR